MMDVLVKYGWLLNDGMNHDVIYDTHLNVYMTHDVIYDTHLNVDMTHVDTRLNVDMTHVVMKYHTLVLIYHTRFNVDNVMTRV